MTASATEAAVRECRQYIGGEFVASDAGSSFDDSDPSTDDVVAEHDLPF